MKRPLINFLLSMAVCMLMSRLYHLSAKFPLYSEDYWFDEVFPIIIFLYALFMTWNPKKPYLILVGVLFFGVTFFIEPWIFYEIIPFQPNITFPQNRTFLGKILLGGHDWNIVFYHYVLWLLLMDIVFLVFRFRK